MSRMGHTRLSEEELLKVVQRKRECNAKAQSVVESFLECCIPREDFLSKLRDINQCHYDDIVDERCILQLCGYPLCGQNLKNIPSQKYQISSVSNKVYDITDRKKFCCSNCFKASEYIKAQLLESPLWLRHMEQIPEFKLLDANDESTVCHSIN